jgi:putative acetyltransferase
MAMDGPKVEALFLDPSGMGQGGGRKLLALARRKTDAMTPLLVDVNENNPAALAFYLRMGFRQTGRSPLDGAGRPFPLLHLELRGELAP